MNAHRNRRMSSRLAVPLLGTAVGVLLAACGASSDGGGSSKNEIRITYLVPITGAFSSYKDGIVNDATLAVDEINKADLGFTIKLDIKDDQCAVSQATTLATQVARQKSADILFDSFCGDAAHAAAAVATKAGVPVVVAGAQGEGLADGELPDIFSTVPSNEQTTELLADKIVESSRIKKVAVLYLNGAWGESILTVLKDKLAKGGVEITDAVPIGFQDTNPLPFIAKAQGKQPDAVVLATGIAQQVPTVKAAAEAGWDTQFLATNSAPYPNFENQAGAAANGTIREFFLVNDNPQNNEQALAYLRAYKAEYGSEPTYPSPSAYDGMKLVGQALEESKAGTDGFNKDAFVKAMKGISHQGVVGEISFDKNGQLKSAQNIVLARSQDGKLEVVTSLD